MQLVIEQLLWWGLYLTRLHRFNSWAPLVCILSLFGFSSLISHNAFPPLNHHHHHPNRLVYKVLRSSLFTQKTTNIKPLWIRFSAKSLKTPKYIKTIFAHSHAIKSFQPDFRMETELYKKYSLKYKSRNFERKAYRYEWNQVFILV